MDTLGRPASTTEQTEKLIWVCLFFSFSHENSYTTDTASLVLSGTANTTLGLLKAVHLIAALCRRSAALLTDVISRLTFR